MAEKVVKIGVKREPGFLYFLRGTDVYKTPMKRAGQASAAGKAEKVISGNFTREEGYLYFLDHHGDIARAKRAVGGQKRKKPKTEKKPVVRSERSLLNEFATMPIFVYRHKGKTTRYGYDQSREHALIAVRIDRESKDAFTGKHDPDLEKSAFTCVRLILNRYEGQPMYSLLVNENGNEDDVNFKDLPSLFKFAREALSNPKFKDTFVSVDEASMGKDGWKTYKRYRIASAKGFKGLTAKAATIEYLHDNSTDWFYESKKPVSKKILSDLKPGTLIKIKSKFGPDDDVVFLDRGLSRSDLVVIGLSNPIQIIQDVYESDVVAVTSLRARITVDEI